jgi:hypothetical protein
MSQPDELLLTPTATNEWIPFVLLAPPDTDLADTTHADVLTIRPLRNLQISLRLTARCKFSDPEFVPNRDNSCRRGRQCIRQNYP